jgi:hypothetical protein
VDIKFISADPITVDMFPPRPASVFIPEWYKKCPQDTFDPMTVAAYKGARTSMTVRGCIPVKDYLTSGYVIVNNVERLINPLADRSPVDFSDLSMTDNLGFHPHEQCPVEIKGKLRHYFKIPNPWGIVTPKGYSCLFYQPEYLFESRFKLMPGIVDTGQYNDAINFIGTFLSEEPFILKVGTPLMTVFPFKRDSWNMAALEGDVGPDPLFKVYLSKLYKRFFHTKKSYK